MLKKNSFSVLRLQSRDILRNIINPLPCVWNPIFSICYILGFCVFDLPTCYTIMTTNCFVCFIGMDIVKTAVLNNLSMTVHPLLVAIWRFSSLCFDNDFEIMDHSSFSFLVK